MSILNAWDNKLSPVEFQRTVTGEIGKKQATEQLKFVDDIDHAIFEVRQQMQERINDLSKQAKAIKKLKKEVQGTEISAQSQTNSTPSEFEKNIWILVGKIASPVKKILTPIFEVIDSIPKKYSKN